MAFRYVGTELELFSLARNWRKYWSSKIELHLGREVLEVGAGIGSVTKKLSTESNMWTALEPDIKMSEQLQLQDLPSNTKIVCGTIESLPAGSLFDTVFYLDVLEHIEDDAKELAKASTLIRPGGTLIVLAPAHNFLMSAFDYQVGHFRRYSKRHLNSMMPSGMKPVSAQYMDSLGFFASLANRYLLKQEQPRKSQIQFWDNTLIPISRILDLLIRYSVGKSVLVIWKKDPTE
jgi:ubiquinone/menaquinone biosynthesis C-methylase UbiE